RIDIRKVEPIKDGGTIIGNRTRAKIVKNKMAPPFKAAEFDIIFGEGISREGSILDVAVDLDIIKKGGSWYSYEGERLGQGRDKVKEYMKANPDFTNMLYDMIMAKVKENRDVYDDVLSLKVSGQDDEQPADEQTADEQ
ncbi:MAG: DNA recombination/repair protein RecA, partial [Clostridia bacterium]|nr:DNA recombination/repair protein RecA [Clostridia bacterium]